MIDLELADITKEKIDMDLSIESSSLYELEQEVRNHPILENKYRRLYTQATTIVDELKLNLEILESKVMLEIETQAQKDGKPIPMSAFREIKKQRLPLNPEYVEAKTNLIKMTSIKNMLGGTIQSLKARSHRLSDLVQLSKQELYSGSVLYNEKQNRNMHQKFEKDSKSIFGNKDDYE